MIFQELLAGCDYHRIAEIWNCHCPEDEEPLDLGTVESAVKDYCKMLQELEPKTTDYVLLALENYVDGGKRVEAELMECKEFYEKLAVIRKRKLPAWEKSADESQLSEFLEKTSGWLPEAFAYEFTLWEETLGTQVFPRNYERIGKDEFIASALYEMSFNGMTRERQEERRKELNNIIDEHNKIQNMPPEEREKHLYSLEDVMEELGCIDDWTEEERTEDRRRVLLDCVKTRCAWIAEFQNIAQDEETK